MIAEFRAKGGTVFLTTHLMNDVEELCDRIAFCVNSRLVEISTPRDLAAIRQTEVKVEYRKNEAICKRRVSPGWIEVQRCIPEITANRGDRDHPHWRIVHGGDLHPRDRG